MKVVTKTCLALAMLVGLAAMSAAQPPAPQAYTRVVVPDIHCMSCAKKILKEVTAVPGVVQMRVDLKAKTIWAMHRQGMTPSPRLLWEAVELAGHKPTRMDAPAGSFTSKPQL